VFDAVNSAQAARAGVREVLGGDFGRRTPTAARPHGLVEFENMAVPASRRWR